ncbi:hypothetical protein Acid345_0395 [Candidatus Koribacter versatilis Ellin345]|uniref:TonB-dependent transporter Oar-like beta-barrel domain-containing protein n=1 Tax=Koribacter versatilis (strain Ellin345) TaxID=204669 RepID=Q1IUQ0_KORVE|nr:carboxypeptidase-like regulatory domain-containing protein [Candidatus Koribacter versatilis]ABF39400.1 hypothetical protein Acid345_0395 [Candidatus Koribacter versatilis Ellin345]
MRISRIRVTFLLFSFVLSTLCLHAQTSTTAVRGTVVDQNGGVISGANVTLHDAKTDFTRNMDTNGQGEYQFVQVPPATYTLTVKMKGFNTTTQTLQLLIGTPATANISMTVGAESTTVDVSGEAPLVNTQDASLGNAFGNIQIKSLPLDARDPTELLSLQAGVVYVGNNNQIDQTFDSRNGATQGARSDQSNVTLDGLDNNDQTNGFAFNGALRSTPDSLEEFRVTTTNSNADQGRSSGAQVQLVTKSGSNKYHGSLYEYHRPTVGVANEWFTKAAEISSGEPNTPQKYLRNNFGGSVGGPIIKDRLFFFFNYEGLRQREDVSVLRTVPTKDLAHGYISYVCGDGCVQRLDPTQIAYMDPQGIGPDPTVMAYLQQYPAPNTTVIGDGLNYSGYVFSSPQPLNQNTSILKLDYNLTANGNHRLFVRGNLQDDTSFGVEQFPGQPASSKTRDNNKGIAAGYTAAFGANWVNNLRYGYIRQGGSTSGLSDQSFFTLRGIDTLQSFSRSASVNVPVQNIMDDVSWIHGNHTIQFGGNYRRIDVYHHNNSNSFSGASSNPSWLVNAGIANTGQAFDPAAYGFPAVDSGWTNNYDYPMGALAGLITEVDTTYNRDRTGNTLDQGAYISRHYRDNEGEFYIQDSWRIKPNLTITGGVRYSLLQPPFESNGLQVQPTINVGDWYQQRWQSMLQGNTNQPSMTFDLSGKGNGGKPYWAWDYKDFAPRLAFAYSPKFEHGPMHWLFGSDGKSSIRGGYGMYYDHFGEGIINTFDQYGSFGLTTTITNPAGIIDPGSAERMNNIVGLPGSILAPPPANGWPITYPDNFAITWGLDDHLKTPYSHVVDFSITREFAKNYVVEASYVGRFGHRLLQQDDLATPLDIVDPKSGMDYFTAATMLVKYANAGADISTVPNIPFWQNIFPNAAGAGKIYGCSNGSDTGANYSATQTVYDLFACVPTNATTALQYLDYPGLQNPGDCFPACSTINGKYGPYHFYDSQFSSLYAWRSIGVSSYHGLELSLRHHGSSNLQFDVNYTFSKSLDMGSDAERISWVSGPGGQIINSWDPRALHALSDFNATHQLNTNWVYNLPFGHGQRWGTDSGRFADAILGGWSLSGILRVSSGYPFSVNNGANWATNWELGGDSILVGPKPKTGTYMINGQPNVFADPSTAINAFRYAYPGESGQRNNLIGPGFFNMDTSLAKAWKITESQLIRFQWDVFNVTNSVRFDALTMAFNNGSIGNSTQFGQYTNTMTQYRRMQFALRYEF